MQNERESIQSPLGDHFPVLSRQDVKQVLTAVPDKRFKCPFCKEELTELSEYGRQNHIEFCRAVVGVPSRVPHEPIDNETLLQWYQRTHSNGGQPK